VSDQNDRRDEYSLNMTKFNKNTHFRIQNIHIFDGQNLTYSSRRSFLWTRIFLMSKNEKKSYEKKRVEKIYLQQKMVSKNARKLF